MARQLLLISALGCAGCFDFDAGPITPIGGCDLRPVPGECVDSEHPFKFLDESPRAVARGGAAPVRFLSLDGNFELRSSAPAIVSIESDRSGGLLQRGLADGSAVIEAIGSAGEQLDSVLVEVKPIAAVGFAYDPAGADPQARLAAVPGATERLRILPRSAEGVALAGAESLLELALTGPISAGSLGEAELRLGRFDLFTQLVRPGFETAIRFDATGPATIAATAGGVELGSLPIDVIAAADHVELVLGRTTTVTQTLEVVGLSGRDARGVPVAGLIGDFTTSPAGLVQIADPHAGEALLQTLAAGTVAITCTLPDRVVTTQLRIEERPE